MGLVQCGNIESQGNVRTAVCLFPKAQKSKGYPVLWTKSIELFCVSFHRWHGDGSNNGVNGNKEKWLFQEQTEGCLFQLPTLYSHSLESTIAAKIQREEDNSGSSIETVNTPL